MSGRVKVRQQSQQYPPIVPLLLLALALSLAAAFLAISSGLVDVPDLGAAPARSVSTSTKPEVVVPPLHSQGEWDLADAVTPTLFIQTLELLGIEAEYEGYNLASVSMESAQIVDIPDLPTPNPDFCKLVESVTGAPCRIEVRKSTASSGEEIADVKWLSGDKVLGEAQALKVKMSLLDETSHLSSYGHGWIGHVKTATWLRGNGAGRFLWHALDASIKGLSTGEAIRILSDSAGWGKALMRDIPVANIIEEAESMWVYFIR